MKGMFLSEIAHRIGSKELGIYPDVQISGFRIDSRLVLPGDLFFALPGAKTDGSRFLADAAARGSLAAVVLKDTPSSSLPLLVVEDVLASLQKLAQQRMLERPIPLLGITGSVGKTTTKEFAASLLQSAYRVGKSPASYNSRVTYPLNLLNFSGDEEILVLEMGMSAPGEIADLVKIAAPDIAIITKIALAHAVNFPDGLEGIARAKAEIFSGAKTKKAIIDLESLPFFKGLSQEIITFSLHDRAADYYLFSADGRYRIDERGVRAYEFDLPFTQSHFLHDFLAAIAAVRTLGLSWENIERAVGTLELPKMRFEQFEQGGVLFVNDAYNANPASMSAALENLPEPKEGGKRIGVLASMLELGPFSQEAHEEIGRLAARKIDALLSLGKETIPLCEAFSAAAKKPSEVCNSLEHLASELQEILCPGDVVLLKGSRGMQLEKILEILGARSTGDVAVTR